MVLLILKGILVGIVMMIPGLSGGSMAMALNIYDNSIDCVSNLSIKNFIYLFKVALGGILGILFFSFFLYKITTFSYFNFFVLFIILLNILILFKQYNKIKFKYILLIAIGYLCMLILNNFNTYNFQLNYYTYFIIGILLAVSLILPGLGASYVLYILNLYEIFNHAITSFDITFMLNISLYTLIGIFLTAKLINYILCKDKFLIYSLVIGLLLGGL